MSPGPSLEAKLHQKSPKRELERHRANILVKVTMTILMMMTTRREMRHRDEVGVPSLVMLGVTKAGGVRG